MKTNVTAFVPRQRISRRAFLQGSALVMLGAAAGLNAAEAAGTPALKVALVTDLHYADREPNGTRFYRESTGKLREAIQRFNEAKADFLVEVGDLIDEAPTVEGEIGHLKVMEAEMAKFKGDRHYVLGNHCVWTLTKEQFYANSVAKPAPYSFDRGGFHFIIFDACYRPDGTAYGAKNFKWNEAEIPPAQRDWLKADLVKNQLPVIAFVHQRFDVENQYGVKSAPAMRKLLEESGKVLAVFQGHSHKNDHHEINGIHYCTLAALIEGSGEVNNSYGVLQVFANGTLKLEGFRQQASYGWSKA